MKRELGIFERAQVIADRYASFHIVGVLRLENGPPPQIVSESLTLLQKRHPFLSVRLVNEKGRYYFTTKTDPPLPFRKIPRWNEEHWQQVVELELSNRIDTTGIMFRCTYLYNDPRSRSEIILGISHSIADAASASHLLHELLTICAFLAEGRAVPISKLPPVSPVESRFPAKFRGWNMIIPMLRYASSQVADEVSYRIQTRGKRTPQIPVNSSIGYVLPVHFSGDVIDSFAQIARRQGVTLSSALNAALLLSVNRHLYAGEKLPMRTFAFPDLRPYVVPPLHAGDLGVYISMMRYTVLVEGGMDFWIIARNLHNQIYLSFKSGEKFTANMAAESLMKTITRFRPVRLSATALNYTGVVPIQPKYGSVKVLEVHGFVSAYGLGPELASQVQLFNNQLFWDFIYLEEDMDHEKAKAVVEEIKGIINSVIAS